MGRAFHSSRVPPPPPRRRSSTCDPYAQQAAVTAAGMAEGVDSEPSSDGGLNLGFITNGTWVRLEGVDFGAVPPAALQLR